MCWLGLVDQQAVCATSHKCSCGPDCSQEASATSAASCCHLVALRGPETCLMRRAHCHSNLPAACRLRCWLTALQALSLHP
jgi:hypothetical protein